MDKIEEEFSGKCPFMNVCVEATEQHYNFP
jgi:hypothetical protein